MALVLVCQLCGVDGLTATGFCTSCQADTSDLALCSVASAQASLRKAVFDRLKTRPDLGFQSTPNNISEQAFVAMLTGTESSTVGNDKYGPEDPRTGWKQASLCTAAQTLTGLQHPVCNIYSPELYTYVPQVLRYCTLTLQFFTASLCPQAATNNRFVPVHK